MSRASDKRQMADTLAAYSLMTEREVASFLRVSEPVAKAMLDDGTIPSMRVGKKMRRVDPLDLIVYQLAERDKVTAADFWEAHGQAVPELARDAYVRMRKLQAGSAA